MLKESLCTVDLFVNPRPARKDVAGLNLILGQFGQERNKTTENLRFDVTGHTFQEVKENLIEAVTQYLDPSRRSSMMYFGNDGKLYTIIVKNGQVCCS